MLRLTIIALFALGLVVPVWAQTLDTAAFAPASAAMYAEIRVDENLESDLQELARIGAALSAESPDEVAEMISFDALLEEAAPGITFEEDILPWLAGSAGVIAVGDMDQPDPDIAAILPVTDAAAAEAFVSEQLTEVFPDISREGDVTIYSNDTYQVVTAPEYILFGTPTAVAAVLAVRDGTSDALTSDEAFLTTIAALPSDPFAWAYISGRWIGEQAADAQQQMSNPAYGGVPGFNELFEAAMQLNPAESAMEDAILEYPPLNGLAFAFEFDDTRLDVTSVLSLKSEYPAPTLSTTTAGTTLLPYIPANAYTVLASYDLTALVGVGAGWTGVFLFGVSTTSFEGIFSEFDNPDGVTVTPPPTPTPVPTPTANDLITQAQSFIQQVEAALGISLDELYGLLSGEYAFAVFPVDNPGTQNIGAALWIRTSYPTRLSNVLDTAMALNISQMSTDATNIVPERTQETINGLDMTVWSDSRTDKSAVYGMLADEVFVLTLKSSLNAVISASRGDGVLSQSRSWPADIVAGYGDGIEAVYYADVAGLMKLNPQTQTGDSPISAIVSNLDFRDNGLFISQTTLTRLSE